MPALARMQLATPVECEVKSLIILGGCDATQIHRIYSRLSMLTRPRRVKWICHCIYVCNERGCVKCLQRSPLLSCVTWLGVCLTDYVRRTMTWPTIVTSRTWTTCAWTRTRLWACTPKEPMRRWLQISWATICGKHVPLMSSVGICDTVIVENRCCCMLLLRLVWIGTPTSVRAYNINKFIVSIERSKSDRCRRLSILKAFSPNNASLLLIWGGGCPYQRPMLGSSRRQYSHEPVLAWLCYARGPSGVEQSL